MSCVRQYISSLSAGIAGRHPDKRSEIFRMGQTCPFKQNRAVSAFLRAPKVPHTIDP